MALILIEQPGDYNGWQGNDITNKIVGYNIRTGQEEILWEGSKG